MPLESIRSEDKEIVSLSLGDVSKITFEPDHTVVFGTALKTCGYPADTSLKGTGRQIYVAFEGLSINRNDDLTINGLPVVRSEAEANVDGQTVPLMIYTSQKNGCFLDVAFWSSEPSGEKRDNDILHQHERVLSNIVARALETL
jgi:hypothetical protein